MEIYYEYTLENKIERSNNYNIIIFFSANIQLNHCCAH